ncbi:MAG TPA: DUF1614 domain-containing protein [Solirubrobacteraceae bacterium]|nr:DUF1614 domain-containing protein [Solirubrobacteraceae bacterium]
MERSYNRHPLGPLLVLWLVAMLGALLLLFLLEAITYAYQQIGISESILFALVIASLAGGLVNIPIARLRSEATLDVREVLAFGVRYRVPVVSRPAQTVLAVNLGGAVIPTAVSLLLLVKDDIWWQAAIGVCFVGVLVHALARPIPGLGIAVPALIPPVLAAAVALTISPHALAALAYVSGTLGTLIGADLTNVRRLGELGTGVASIGGAGTFDGVFLSGIVAVLLVGLA